jgi:hypothetical protein
MQSADEVERHATALALKVSAIQCFYSTMDKAGGNDRLHIRLAVLRFKVDNPEYEGKNPSRFIHDCVADLEERGCLHPRSGPGREPVIPDDVAKKALARLWEGFEAENGEQRYFTGIKQAVKLAPVLYQIMHEHGVKDPYTLLRAMQRVEPDLRRERLRVKFQHSPALRAERRQAAITLKSWPVEQLLRVFWIDATTIYLLPEDMMVYAPPGSALVLHDPRIPGHNNSMRKLKFYICVNAVLGPVAIKFVTGTTEFEEEHLVGVVVGWGSYMCVVVCGCQGGGPGGYGTKGGTNLHTAVLWV